MFSYYYCCIWLDQQIENDADGDRAAQKVREAMQRAQISLSTLISISQPDDPNSGSVSRPSLSHGERTQPSFGHDYYTRQPQHLLLRMKQNEGLSQRFKEGLFACFRQLPMLSTRTWSLFFLFFPIKTKALPMRCSFIL